MVNNQQDNYSLPNSNDTSKKDGVMPYSDLEFQYITTSPAWGREVTAELDNMLIRHIKRKRGEPVPPHVGTSHLWGILSYYTRDVRLGNLSGQEVRYCNFWLDYAGKCIRHELPRAFLSALTKAITVLEVSQSKGGFLRKRTQTITREEIRGSGFDADTKKDILGKKRT